MSKRLDRNVEQPSLWRPDLIRKPRELKPVPDGPFKEQRQKLMGLAVVVFNDPQGFGELNLPRTDERYHDKFQSYANLDWAEAFRYQGESPYYELSVKGQKPDASYVVVKWSGRELAFGEEVLVILDEAGRVTKAQKTSSDRYDYKKVDATPEQVESALTDAANFLAVVRNSTQWQSRPIAEKVYWHPDVGI